MELAAVVPRLFSVDELPVLESWIHRKPEWSPPRVSCPLWYWIILAVSMRRNAEGEAGRRVRFIPEVTDVANKAEGPGSGGHSDAPPLHFRG